MLRRVRLRAVFDRNFRKFCAAAKILHSKSQEIAPKSMPPGGAQLAHDPVRSPTFVPSVGMLRRARLRAILDRKVRNFSAAAKILNFRPRSHENLIAPKSMPPGGAQLAHDPVRSPTFVPSVGMLRRARLRAIFDRKFRIFSAAAAKFFVRNRVRSRQNPCQLATRSLVEKRRGLKAFCGAAACCGT